MRVLSLFVLALALGATVATAQGVGAAAAPEPADTESKQSWNDVIDLIDSKNDTSLIFNLIQAAGLEDAVDSITNTTATVFIPLDADIAAAAASINVSDTAAVAKILQYHVVPGQRLTLDELTDGLVLQTAVPGPEGKIKISITGGSKKPRVVTTSGQRVPIYQFNLDAGDAVVHTIRGVLIPGTQGLPAGGGDAAAPAPAK